MANQKTAQPLNAKNLKEALWDTLQGIKGGLVEPSQADAVASQAREIIRTVNTQLRVANQTKRNVSKDVVDFSENK